MFSTLRAEMARREWSISDLAKQTGIIYTTMLSKFRGKTYFTMPEMQAIHKCFPEINADDLFDFNKTA